MSAHGIRAYTPHNRYRGPFNNDARPGSAAAHRRTRKMRLGDLANAARTRSRPIVVPEGRCGSRLLHSSCQRCCSLGPRIPRRRWRRPPRPLQSLSTWSCPPNSSFEAVRRSRLSSAALIITEAQLPWFRAPAGGIDQGAEFCEGHELDRDTATLVPASAIGRMLSQEEGATLIRRLRLERGSPETAGGAAGQPTRDNSEAGLTFGVSTSATK